MSKLELQYDVEQFLYSEARLLDEWKYLEWLGLFTEDVSYWLPSRESMDDPNVGISEDKDLAIYDDDKTFLAARVARLDSAMAHAERPQSRTRHFVSNIQVAEKGQGTVEVHSNILVYQSRQERTEVTYVGRREDHLRKEGDSWRISFRKIVLDPTIIPRSISVFF